MIAWSTFTSFSSSAGTAIMASAPAQAATRMARVRAARGCHASIPGVSFRHQMRRRLITLVVGLSACASSLVAQGPEPPALTLPVGVRARVFTGPGHRIEGTLVNADSASITLVPKGSHPLATSQMTLPMREVKGLEVAVDRKGHAWQGLLIGVLAGVAMGAAEDVDPVTCKTVSMVSCSRAGAIGEYAGGAALLGLLIGSYVKSDRWTPVALDALGPPLPRPVAQSRAWRGFAFTFRF